MSWRRGVIALPTVMVIGLIVLLAGIGLAGTGFVETLAGMGSYESERAFSIAEAAAQDAYKRLGRNKNCICGYNGSFLDGTAEVIVSGTNPKIVRSTGRIRNKQRTIQLTLLWDTYDKMTHAEWKEVTD